MAGRMGKNGGVDFPSAACGRPGRRPTQTHNRNIGNEHIGKEWNHTGGGVSSSTVNRGGVSRGAAAPAGQRASNFAKHFAAFALAAAAVNADAATWTGGASGDIADAANWDGDIATSAMMFTNDCTVTLSSDLSNAYSLFTDNTAGNGDAAARFGKNVSVNLNGFVLNTIGAGSSGNHYWRASDASLTIYGGTFENVQSEGTTNTVCLDNATLSRNMKLIATGSGTKFVSSYENRAIPGDSYIGGSLCIRDNAVACGNKFNFASVNSTNDVSGGAQLFYGTEFGVGKLNSAADAPNARANVFRVSGGTVAPVKSQNGNVSIGYRGSHGNEIVVENGGVLTVGQNLQIGTSSTAAGLASSNNVLRVTGEGSKAILEYTGGPAAYVGSTTSLCGGNSIVVENGGELTHARQIYVGAYGTNNSFVVRSGGKVSATGNNAKDIELGSTTAGRSANARFEVVGNGTEVDTRWLVVRNAQGDISAAPTVFIGDGAAVNINSLRFIGEGGTFAVGNATVTVTTFMPNGPSATSVGTNATLRIEGDAAQFTCARVDACDGTLKRLTGKVHLEFCVPENGWSAAPFNTQNALTIGGDTTLALDKASVREYLRAHPEGGTIPLIDTGSAWRAITVEDMAALSANLPDGCSLVNGGRTLSVKIAGYAATVLCFR